MSQQPYNYSVPPEQKIPNACNPANQSYNTSWSQPPENNQYKMMPTKDPVLPSVPWDFPATVPISYSTAANFLNTTLPPPMMLPVNPNIPLYNPTIPPPSQPNFAFAFPPPPTKTFSNPTTVNTVVKKPQIACDERQQIPNPIYNQKNTVNNNSSPTNLMTQLPPFPVCSYQNAATSFAGSSANQNCALQPANNDPSKPMRLSQPSFCDNVTNSTNNLVLSKDRSLESNYSNATKSVLPNYTSQFSSNPNDQSSSIVHQGFNSVEIFSYVEPPPNNISIIAEHIPTSVSNPVQLMYNDHASHNRGFTISATSTSDFLEESLNVLLTKFKTKTSTTSIIKKCSPVSIAEFVSTLKESFSILQVLSASKKELGNVLHSDEPTWNLKIKNIIKQQNRLCDLINALSDPDRIKNVLVKLEKVKKKRLRLRNQRREIAISRQANEQSSIELCAKIDRWHEVHAEKALQRKREAELKKEADYILSEVRRKILSVRQMRQRLKAFEKLRNSRKENAIKKGMLILPLHDRNFEKKMSEMNASLKKQLTDYEAEEHALKVMLETEQDGQREKEAQQRLKQSRERQNNKHSLIVSALFTDTVPPDQSSDMFLFDQYYEAGNRNIQSLINIRHEWDRYLVPANCTEGSSIPQRWIVPAAPSCETWKTALSDEE